MKAHLDVNLNGVKYMIYNIFITTVFIILLIVVLKNFIKVIYFTKNNNFDKKYKATRINANKYSVDKW